ncbi:uncharacterized protein LOC128553177, partial [Mercenaria mercenaria]|uniref:uncharacterized protein LOC128553177 n=1 Tax=Mercenaria mercenaria TaxID=6596 RepID=UPI00234EF75A
MELNSEHYLGRTVDNNTTLIILAWQNKSLIAQEFRCCIRSSEKITTQDVMNLNRRGGTDIQVMRIECLLHDRHIDITGVSLTTKHRPCSENEHHYISATVLSPYEQDNSVAMCNDLLYGTVNPKSIVEWFEIHRFLGVDKFTIHQDRSLNSKARHVLQYYQREGILEVLDFESPIKDTIYRRQRAEKLPKYESKKESQQMWTDESLAIFDCRERHKHFAFAVDIDLDEFIVTQIVKHNAIKIHLRNPTTRRLQPAKTQSKSALPKPSPTWTHSICYSASKEILRCQANSMNPEQTTPQRKPIRTPTNRSRAM